MSLFSSSGSSQVKASTSTGVEAETSTKLPLAWTSLLKKPLANQEATVTAASSIEKSNTAQISELPTQNPSTSSDIGSTSEWRPGKNYERNQRRKQRKRMLKGMEGMTLTNPGGNLSPASKSTPKKRSRESCSTQSTPASNPKQKRGRITSEHVEQVGTKRAEEVGPSTAASYAKAVRTSNQRLVITRKGSKGDTLWWTRISG